MTSDATRWYCKIGPEHKSLTVLTVLFCLVTSHSRNNGWEEKVWDIHIASLKDYGKFSKQAAQDTEVKVDLICMLEAQLHMFRAWCKNGLSPNNSAVLVNKACETIMYKNNKNPVSFHAFVAMLLRSLFFCNMLSHHQVIDAQHFETAQ